MRPCPVCAVEQPLGPFDKKCEACRVEATKAACVRCHERKLPEEFPVAASRRSTVCQLCVDTEREERERKARERQATREVAPGRWERRCVDCREWKELIEHFPVAYGDQPEGPRRRHRVCKPCSVERTRRYRQDVMADPKAAARHRAYNARMMREWRAKNPEKARAARRRHMARVRRSPAKWEAYLERQRINYRLRAEREGRTVSEERARWVLASRRRKRGRPAQLENRTGRVHAAPLAVAIYRAALEEGVSPDLVCARFDVPPRTLYRWAHGGEAVDGSAALAQHAIADRVLVGLGLLWWEVYDPASAPELYDPLEWIDAVDAAALAWEGEGAIAPRR